MSNIKQDGAAGIKVIENPGSAIQAVKGNSKHQPGAMQGTAPDGTSTTFSGR